MKRKIVSIILSATMLLGAVSLSACSSNELEAKFAELEAQITQLQDQNEELQASLTQQQGQIAELEQENDNLQSSVIEQQDQIAMLEQENEGLEGGMVNMQSVITDLETEKLNQQEKINALEQENEELQEQINEQKSKIQYGVIYTLEEVHEKGFITFEDLKSIAYYNNGSVGANKEILGENFKPKEIEPLTDDIKYKIQVTVAINYREDKEYPRPQTVAEEIDIEDYCGVYNGYYIVLITPNFISYPAVHDIVNYYGLEFSYAYRGQALVAWKEIS